MPQARRASLLGRRVEVHPEKIGAYGGVADSGAVPLITAAERGLSTGSFAANAAVGVGVRLSLPFHETPPEGRFLSSRARCSRPFGESVRRP